MEIWPYVSLLSRLFGRNADARNTMGRAQVRPLWHRVVELSRDPAWYRTCGVADTVPGRFDAVNIVLCAVLLRMESDPELMKPAALLTELFVEDMDGQLRQSGVGDLIVGKHIGRLMGVLGGRLGAYREALTADDDGALTEAVARNVTLIEGASPNAAAARFKSLRERLAALPPAALLAGDIK
jgi:cytochrome b pre-mRNA-processing protein 3